MFFIFGPHLPTRFVSGDNKFLSLIEAEVPACDSVCLSGFPGQFIYNDRADKQNNLTDKCSHLKITKSQRDSATLLGFHRPLSDTLTEISSIPTLQFLESLMSKDEIRA